MSTIGTLKNTLTLTAVLALCASSALAQQQPSAKVTAKTANWTLVPEVVNTTDAPISGEWTTLLSNKIKVANQKDLLISASFEVGLYTETLVRSKLMVTDSSTAVANVDVQVVITDEVGNVRIVEPGPVTFGRRSQTLSATLEGAILGCFTVDPLTGSIILNPDLATCVTAEEIALILDTMDAATFNFVATDVPQGVQTISVQARVGVSGTVQSGTYKAKALIGKGSMTAESVRMIKGEDVVLPEL